MPRATLILDADTSALRRSLGEIPGITQRVQSVMTSQARRGGRERVGIDQTFAREHESIHMRLARAREKQAREVTRTTAAEARKQALAEAQSDRERERSAQALARAQERYERDTTRASAAEGRRRVRNDADFARERDRIHERLMREQTRREAAATRERRAAGREAGGHAAQVVGTVVTDAQGRIQGARQTAADRTSAINTSLVQRGTSREENDADNARIQARLAQVRTGVAPEVAIAAIAGAQASANALGGDTRAQRAAGIESTLGDVELAGAIDPQNVNGIVRMGAILRRRVGNPAMRDRILRGAVGTSFEGSVETDQMITSALPGLLAAISTGTANAAPADRDRITADIAQDFFAQVQAQAAGGRSVGVSANRTNTVRTALGNAPRQNRLGLALAETARTGTPEQQAAFAAAFTKDAAGQYSMNASTRDTPSSAARFFGTMFNNDAGAMRNAMGANGLGGARQLMNIPDVAAIASYFGMTTGRDGSAMREYDHVDQLKSATLTPEQEATMTATRAGEDRTRMMREQEAALAASRTPGAATRASDTAASFATAHPILAALGLSGAGAGGTALARSAGASLVGTLGAGPAALVAALTAGGTALGAYGSMETARTGTDAQGREVSAGERVARGAAAVGSSIVGFGPLLSAVMDLPRQFAAALRENPPQAIVTPHDAAQVASGATPGRARRGEL